MTVDPTQVTLLRMDNVGIVVDDLDDVLARLQTRGAELVGEVVQSTRPAIDCETSAVPGHHHRLGRAAQVCCPVALG